MELGDLLVHGDALDRETLCGIGIAHRLEAFNRFGNVAEAGVEIADRVVDSKILGIALQDLFVLSNGVLQLALLDKLFRGAENFLFVEAKTKRHRMRTPAFSRRAFRPTLATSASLERLPTSPGRFPDETPPTARPGSQSTIAEEDRRVR